MKVQLKGVVVNVETKKGTSAKGTEWKSKTIVLESGDKYKEYYPVEFGGDNFDKADGIRNGDNVEIEGYLGGRKWEKDGKTSYFLSVRGFEVSIQGGAISGTATQPVSGDLPF
jgi:hypothetical protein